MKIEKRKALLGEQILIINPRAGVTKYKKHNILTVSAVRGDDISGLIKKDGDVSVTIAIKEDSNPKGIIFLSEYLVYTPTVYKPTTTYKSTAKKEEGYRMPVKGVGATDLQPTLKELKDSVKKVEKQSPTSKWADGLAEKLKKEDEENEKFWNGIKEEERKRLEWEDNKNSTYSW